MTSIYNNIIYMSTQEIYIICRICNSILMLSICCQNHTHIILTDFYQINASQIWYQVISP